METMGMYHIRVTMTYAVVASCEDEAIELYHSGDADIIEDDIEDVEFLGEADI